ncbi:MAG TPA: class I SAM-dependent methyltransferase [Terriglobales bacterium]|nr:class I SAM-dependent methyltransferase [Terriglobales bacterium]
MEHVQRTYLPAAGRDWALPLYDPLVKLLGADKVRRTLLDQAAVQPGHRALDIGCGTGTLAVLIKQLYPAVEVIGLDPDPKALARASRKADKARLSLRFDQGFSDELPYPEASFDRVFSSFMFHHLPANVREKTLREARRVLVPGGSLHMVDFEPSKSQGILARHIAGDQLKENSENQLLGLMGRAGFTGPVRVLGGATLFGTLHFGYYEATVACLPQ